MRSDVGRTRLETHARARRARRAAAWRSFLAPLVLVSALVAAQAVAISHDSDLDRHPADEVCVLCISIGSLGVANLATPHAHAAPVSEPPAAAGGAVLAVVGTLSTPHARAPPRAS